MRLTPLEVVLAARKMIDENRTDAARILLTRAEFAPSEIEMERRYLLGVLAVKTGRIDEAILIYRDLLNKNPRLAKIRIELALAYMARKSWYLADYHLRLAAAEKLPPGIDEKSDICALLSVAIKTGIFGSARGSPRIIMSIIRKPERSVFRRLSAFSATLWKIPKNPSDLISPAADIMNFALTTGGGCAFLPACILQHTAITTMTICFILRRAVRSMFGKTAKYGRPSKERAAVTGIKRIIRPPAD